MDGIIIVGIIALALLGAPLFAVFGGAAILLFHNLTDTSITGVANDVFSQKFADSPLLSIIVFFTFAGYLMAESETARRLVEVSRAWLGWLPGGLAIVCLVASAFFTTFTGGSGITIVAVGGLLYPALLQDDYSENFSLGLVTTGGSLGLLFPPSVPMIIYGILAGVLIEKLFLAGLVPGILSVGMLSAYAIWNGKQKKRKRPPFDARSAFKTLWHAKWEVALPVGLLFGLYSGLLRIQEAAAFTAIYVLFIEVVIYRDLSLHRDVPKIVRESMILVGAILIILATAIGFTGFLIQAQVPMKILAAMQVLISSKWMFLLVLNIFLLIVGMLMDIFSAIAVVVPLIVPIAHHFGVDPYHLGVVFLLNLEIGYLTPPVGLNLFISSFRFGKPVDVLYRAVLPFIGMLVIVLALTTYVPGFSTALADLIHSDMIQPSAATTTPAPRTPRGPAPGAPKDQSQGLTLDDLDSELGLGDAGAAPVVGTDRNASKAPKPASNPKPQGPIGSP